MKTKIIAMKKLIIADSEYIPGCVNYVIFLQSYITFLPYTILRFMA
jgi:hypothetical protein